MADIIVHGMEMPVEHPITLILDPNGRVWLPDTNSSKEYMTKELPPHGDLIDKDAFIQWLASQDELWERSYTVPQLKEMLRKGMPVIVPRSE